MAFDVAGAKQAGYSDIEIAEFLGQQKNFDTPAAIKAGYSPSEIIGHLGESATPAAKGETGFLPSVYRGGRGLASLATDVIPAMAGKAVGAEEFAKRKMQEAAQYQQQTEQLYPAEVASYKDIKDVGSFLTYVKEAIGEAVPSIVPSIFTGGAAAVLGRGATAAAQQAGTALARRELLEATAKGTLTKELRDEIKEKAIQAGAKAAQQSVLKQQAAGALAGSAVQNIPDVYQNIYETTGQQDLGAAIAFGSFNAALDAITPFNVLRKMQKSGLGPEEIAAAWYKRAGKGAAKGFVTEGGTEALQEVSSAAAEKFVDENQDFFSSKNFDRFINAGLKGGFGGAGITATTDVAFGKSKPEAKPTQEKIQTIPELPATEEIKKPPEVQQLIDRVSGVSRTAEEQTPLTAEEAQRQRINMLQQKADEDAKLQEEKARSQGIPPSVPPAPPQDVSKPSLYETELPQPTAQEDLEAKQAEIDQLRLDAGLPTGPSSKTPGIQPTTTTTEEAPKPKIVDERPLQERAAKNRLLVLQNMLKNEGGDPNSLSIVPHPEVEGKFAIQSLDVPVKFQKDLKATASDRPESTPVIDPVNAYIEIARRTNTPASMRLVKDFEEGIVTREDIEAAIEAERKANQPMPINYKGNGEPWFVAPVTYKPRGERVITEPIEEADEVTEDPTVGEGVDPPTPTTEMPQTLGEFKLRMPAAFDNPDVRAANKNASFSDLMQALMQSKNPVIKRIGELGNQISNQVTLQKTKYLGNRYAGLYYPALDAIKISPKYAGDETTNAHETLHALIYRMQKNPTTKQKVAVKKIEDLYQHVKRELAKQGMGWDGNKKNKQFAIQVYGLADQYEFAAEAMSNPEFQYMLMQIPYEGKRSAWSAFTQYVAELLGIKDTNALTEILNLVDKIAQTKRPARNYLSNKVVRNEVVYKETEEAERETAQKPAKKGEDNVARSDESTGGTGVQVPVRAANELPAAQGVKGTQQRGVASVRPTPTKPAGGAGVQPTPVGQETLNILDEYGRNVEKTTENRIEKFKETVKDAAQNPKVTLDNAQSAFTKFLNYLETKVFSSDAALNNEIRKSMGDLGQDASTKIGMLLQTSLSQTVHSDAVANLFLRYGNIEYNNDLKKWVKKDSDASFVELSKRIDKMAERSGLTKEEAESTAHFAFEVKRTKSLIKFNEDLKQKIAETRAEAARIKQKSPVASSELSKKASSMEGDLKYIHFTDEQLASGILDKGMKLFNMHPDLNEAVDVWNKIRDNASKVLIDSGLWSASDAEFLLSNADYVPFYREDQLEQGKGPKEYIKGLQVQAKERKLKGSAKPVNNIFDNQVLWVQYSINRAVRNKSAVSLAEAAESVGAAKRIKNLDSKENIGVVGVDDNNKPIAGKVSDGAEPFNSLQQANFANQQVEGFEVVEFEDDNQKTKYLLTPKVEKKNVVKVWRNGKQVEYSMEDPLYMEAFNGLESVAIPMFKLFSKFADMLRQSVVMYPLFTISQIPQDSFAAIFSSGLKPQHALKIPILAVKEFIQTLRGKSAAHEELKNVGAVGVRDFTSAMVRMDAEIFAGIKAPPGVLGKAKGWLTHFAMAGDNAVRQAVYEASLAQGLSKAEAMEKAFEIFNARRKGSSKTLALASQVIPFFNAYLAAQNVAYKVITGRGVSPTQRADAYKTLAATTGSVMVLSILYSMIASDDDDYLEKPVGQRDRAFIIPGTGGMMIPLRKDLFTMPKVIAEHTYLMLTDKGSEDGRKFRDSVAAGLMSSILGPTPVPQAIKPFAEWYLNYDFYQQKPLIGTYQKKLDTERQFNESTSELSKLIGQTGLISPIVLDHLVRGLFGSVGGLVLYITNPFLYSGASGERPSMSFRDAVATLPGTSGFISKEYENAMKRDFYVLKDEVDKAANTFADLKTRSPQEIEEFLKDEKNVARVGMSKSVNKIADQLSKLRKYMEQVRNSDMPADEKRDRIKELKESESNMMKNIDVKALREMGKI